MLKIMILLTLSFNLYAKCDMYIERPEYAENKFFDLNILDEYSLGTETVVKNKEVKDFILKVAPKMQFGDTKLNKQIYHHIKETKILKLKQILNFDNQTRKAYILINSFDKENYYSFILYSNCSID